MTDVVEAPVAPPKLRESIVLGLLREKYTRNGNGGSGEYAFLPLVRNGAGFSADRTFDALVMDLWPSRGLVVDVFEVKVSRSDWLRELKDPAKAEAACTIGDRFTVVAPVGCVKPGELPPTWGLIEILGDGTEAKPWKLRTKTAAPYLRARGKKSVPDTLPRGLVVSMLRAAPGAVPGGRNPSAPEKEIREARDEGWQAGHKAGVRDGEGQRENATRQNTDKARSWDHLVEALVAAGLTRYEAQLVGNQPETIARAIRSDDADGHLADTAARLERAAESIRKFVANPKPGSPPP